MINLVIARFAGADALGVFNQVFAFYILVSQFSVIGIHFSILHSLSYYSSDNHLQAQIAVSGLVLTVLIALPVTIIAWLTSDFAGAFLDSENVAAGLKIALPGVFAFSLNKVLLNLLNGVTQMRAFAVFQASRFLLILAGVCIVSMTGMPDVWLAGSLTAAEFVLLSGLLIYVNFKAIRMKIEHVRVMWLGKHFSFGMRGFLSGALAEANTRIDVLSLGFFLSDKEVGIYSFAAVLAEGIRQINMVFRRNVDPLLGESFASNNLDSIRQFSRKLLKVTIPLMLLTGIVCVLLFPFIAEFTGKESYSTARNVFAALILGGILAAGMKPFSGILLQGGKPGWQTVLISILVLGNIVGNAILIPIMGMMGAAVATSAMLVFESILILLMARILLKVRLV